MNRSKDGEIDRLELPYFKGVLCCFFVCGVFFFMFFIHSIGLRYKTIMPSGNGRRSVLCDSIKPATHFGRTRVTVHYFSFVGFSSSWCLVFQFIHGERHLFGV